MSAESGQRRIDLVDADAVQAAVADLRDDEEPVVVLLIQRREIEANNIGTTVDRLMALSDSARTSRRLANSVHLVFTGYDFDTREIHEIPVIRAYIQHVASHWNYWFHFLSAEADDVPLLLRLLTPVQRRAKTGNTVYAEIVDVAHFKRTMLHLFHGLNTLHAQYAIPDATTVARTDEIMISLRRMLGE